MNEDQLARILRELNAIKCLLLGHSTTDAQYKQLLQGIGNLQQIIAASHSI